MKKLIIAAIGLALLLTGCETNSETVEAFNKGKPIECSRGPFSFSTVITNERWKYSDDLMRFYDASGNTYLVKRCYSTY